MKNLFRSAAAIAAMCLWSCGEAADTVRLRLTITSPMPYSNTPLDPEIDFSEFICTAAVAGVLDPNSIEIRDATTDEIIPHAITEDFAYSDKARLEFVASDSNQREFDIRFRTVDQRPALQPQFEQAASVRVNDWQACRVVDLNGDGALDLVVDGEYLRNDNPDGWPFRAAKSVRLNAGRKPCFLDMDQDGQLDAVCLHGADTVQPYFYRIAWRKNLGGNPPALGEHEILNEIDPSNISLVSAWSEGNESGLIVQHDALFWRSHQYHEPRSAPLARRFRRRWQTGFDHLCRMERLSILQSCSVDDERTTVVPT